MSFASEEYSDCKKWIAQKIEDGNTWDEIKNFCVSPTDALSIFDYLQNEELIIPQNMSFEDWPILVDEMKQGYTPLYVPTGLSDGHLNNSLVVPTDSGSAWVRYKNYLMGVYDGKPKMTEEAVGFVEKNCHWILNHLSRDTRASGPVKGLVMGSVQSGKTANMIGLSAMAAHYDWNVIIILSGTIDNLRVQTWDRFLRDLKRSGGVSWHVLDHTSNPDYFADVEDKSKKYLTDDLSLNIFQNGSSSHKWLHRYVMVCLKNPNRLRRLISWLHSNPAKAARMRILVIDDEADQASINTQKMGEAQTEEEILRTTVNQLIIDLVNGNNEDGSKSTSPFQSMNYISFTATPYANVLNEAYESSLYPKNFISNLPESKEYFGAKVIFGSHYDDKYPGLNIVRNIPDSEVKCLKLVHKGGTFTIPEEMQKSIAWFLCAAAVLRIKGHRKPISMLIHTTALQNGHLSEYELIKSWLMRERNTGSIINTCEAVYYSEVAEFTLNDLKEGYPDYGNMDKVDPEMPEFNAIRSEIQLMLSDITNILMDEDNELTYSEDAIHLCVDNCRAKKYADEGTQLRLIYDQDKISKLNKAPVFIVMGGNTLSRGLTIEGLVCSYFARNSNLADTLMQMARWFGYRTGYELLQRIWMPEPLEMKYRLLEQIEEKLKKEFEDFMERGISPSKFGPRIMNSAVIAKFMLTSKNKSQNSVECDFDFSGDSYEVTQFDDDIDELQNNIDCTDSFLNSLNSAVKSQVSGSSYVWKNVDFSAIRTLFFDKYIISEHSTLTNDIPIFLEWIGKMNAEENKYTKWNVAIAGDRKSEARWTIGDIDVGKIERTKKSSKPQCIDIGSLRSGTDVLCDVDYDSLSPSQKQLCNAALKTKKNMISRRNDLGLKDIPLLLLYRIDKDGGKDTAGGRRIKINTPVDVIGFSIIIPGESSGGTHAKSVTVKLPE